MGTDFSRRASFLLPLSLVGCQKTRSPESVSEAFIDRYYIEKNHSRALELSSDLAAKRVSEEKRLLEQGGAYAGAQPRVFYNHVKTEAKADRTEVVYALTIDAGGVKLKKEVRVEVVPAPSGEGFRVAAFNERDLQPE